MKKQPLFAIALASSLCWLVGCKQNLDSLNAFFNPVTKETQSKREKRPVENIDDAERAIAAKLEPAKDPVAETINALYLETRPRLENRRFDELEATAAKLRAPGEVFGDGSWKIARFYESFECGEKEPESTWQLHDRLHQEWIAAKPGSITAHVAYASFLIEYAWKARGSGYANTVTKVGLHHFANRLASAQAVLKKAGRFPEKDPIWWLAALRVALGMGYPPAQYDALVAEATRFQPTFWEYDTSRAYSLLPRWYGKKGDWEAYAAKASDRPGGPGAETYARIVIRLRPFHENIFRDSTASWPKTREGLEEMRRKYPDSLAILSNSALLATMSGDRAVAKEMFDRLGDRYLPEIWRKPERFAHYRHWAQTGEW